MGLMGIYIYSLHQKRLSLIIYGIWYMIIKNSMPYRSCYFTDFGLSHWCVLQVLNIFLNVKMLFMFRPSGEIICMYIWILTGGWGHACQVRRRLFNLGRSRSASERQQLSQCQNSGPLQRRANLLAASYLPQQYNCLLLLSSFFCPCASIFLGWNDIAEKSTKRTCI